MDPSVLTVYKCPFPKVRLGKDYDGGYIIAELPNVTYSILLAGGILDDISFEEDFLKKYPVPCIAYDGTIPNLPKENTNIKFIRKNIGYAESTTVTNLHSTIAQNDTIFVKMDIEGGEIPWVESLSEEQINTFAQIVMEFHNPFSQREISVFDKLNKNHILVHFHANNCCGTRVHKGVIIPNIFECTYIHRKYVTTPLELNKEPIPSPIDMKNVIHKSEIAIQHPPFVNGNLSTK
jgi:hypothetical protein